MTGKSLHFKYAPPLKGTRKSKLVLPTTPYTNAPLYKHSVFYYWWEYLRRNKGYEKTCKAGGRGIYKSLFLDFGNVHEHDDFMLWWDSHAHLFSEPLSRKIECLEDCSTLQKGSINVSVPLEVSTGYLVKLFKEVLREHKEEAKAARNRSLALYAVATKPVLRSLHQHLVVWDIKQNDPSLKHYEIAELAGIRIYNDGNKIEVRKKISVTISRHLRIANQYIENIVSGEFPKRDRR
jgi:hypothetical protein